MTTPRKPLPKVKPVPCPKCGGGTITGAKYMQCFNPSCDYGSVDMPERLPDETFSRQRRRMIITWNDLALRNGGTK